MADALSADCTRKQAAHDSGIRPLTVVKWIVLHSTEGATAAGAAGWFANPASEGSAHLVVDNNECYRCLDNNQIPWAAAGGGNVPGGSANYCGFHIEQAGYAKWTRKDWLVHDAMLRRGAYKAAVHAKLFGIPLRWVGPVGLRLGRKGFTTHRDISYAWPVQARPYGFHTDPGKSFPKDVFLAYARSYSVAL